jgi:peroxiredoxin
MPARWEACDEWTTTSVEDSLKLELLPSPSHTLPRVQVEVMADTTGAFARQLGVELGSAGEPGARSMRYSAVVEDGILLKLVGGCAGLGACACE